ncbi:MAG: hypothetical protein IJW16_05865, partial [Clostridia bacterium]|nr:hypothetical protein [Clostridia bacterium]
IAVFETSPLSRGLVSFCGNVPQSLYTVLTMGVQTDPFYPNSKTSLKFLKGVWGKLFSKSFPHKSPCWKVFEGVIGGTF